MYKRLLRYINLLFVFITISVNGLANALPLNGLNTGEISDRFKVFFVPAGYVFSIWGIIYLGLIAFGIFQILPSQKDNARLDRIGGWFIMSCFANIIWLFLWHYEQFPLTLLAMVVLLISLIMVYLKLGIGKEKVSVTEQWFVRIPFSIYLGWVSVATVANVTSLLYYLKWGGFGLNPQLWAVIMLVVAVVLAFLMSLSRYDMAYPAVFIWAFIGIAIKQSSAPLVATSAFVAAGLALVALLVSVISKPKVLNQ